MPKVTLPSLPVSALFGVNKPSGPTSMSVINDIKLLICQSKLFADPSAEKKKTGKRRGGEVKVGQGGTLDPLADGVLVVAVGRAATKRLGDFLDCVKEYRTTCLLGCETDTYDSEGSRVRIAPWKHVTQESVEAALQQFRGKIKQKPPIFSALKMNGMPLYDYARKGIPLPRPIEEREVTVHSLKLEKWIGNEHEYQWPQKVFSSTEKDALQSALSGQDKEVKIVDDVKGEQELNELCAGTAGTGEGAEGGQKDAETETVPKLGPTAFVLSMRVSGGTYVRSIVHDLALSLGSAGHVVTLTRTRQNRYVTTASLPAVEEQVPVPVEDEKPEPSGLEAETKPETSTEEATTALPVGPEVPVVQDKICVPWEVFERARDGTDEPDEDGWREWEREVMANMDVMKVN